MEAWVNIKREQNEYATIIQARKGNAGYSFSLARITGQMDITLPGLVNHIRSRNVVTLREWTHLAVTFDGQTFKLYMNGELDFDKSVVGAVKSRGIDDPIYIGRNVDAGNPEPPDGMIDEVRLSNIARTQEEIKEAMEGLQIAVESLNKVATTWGRLKSEY
jgi:hypothetical protein